MVKRMEGKRQKAKAKSGDGRRQSGSIISFAFLLLTFAFAATAEAPPDRVSGGIVLRVSGAVQHPLELTVPDLRAMPAAEPRWTRDSMTHTARGVDLMALVARAGLKENAAVKNHSLRFAVVARGRDGYQAVFSLGELSPKLGGKGAVVAYEEDGAPLPDRAGTIELMATADLAPSRWVRDLTEIAVVDLDTTHLPHGPKHLAP
jgi:DMSO/TMAO reductase YedYZ molybdopterin-dependent catalytic subunit